MDVLKRQMMEINQLCSESDGLYHDIAQKHGISDSIYWILYILYNSDIQVSQTELCGDWFYSKQTVNSAISAMAKKGWISLETIPKTRNRKNVVLTEAGHLFGDEVIGGTYELEKAAFGRISEEDREQFLRLFRMTNEYMREEYEKRYACQK